MEVVNQKENELHVYSINENEYVGVIKTSTFDHYNTVIPIVILECSSAAGDAPARLVKEVLPLVMSKVKNWSPYVRLITFGDESVHKSLSKRELSEFDLKSGGAANIGPAIEKLRSYFEACVKKMVLAYSFDVLIISAGEVGDHENAERETKKLTDFLPTTDAWTINSQAVRLFTTSNNHQPDTKALSYLLQINNSTEANFCDINVTSSNDTIANEIAGLFPDNDQKRSCIHVEIPYQPIILRFPWRSSQHSIFPLTAGLNIFWLTELPGVVDMYASSISPINVLVRGQLTVEKFQQLMEQKLPQILSHMKILKIVGTAEANETVDQILSYFAKTEVALALKCSTPNNKSVTNVLAGMAMYKPKFRDSAEMFEFYCNSTKVIEDQIENERSSCRQEKEEERRKKVEEQLGSREEKAHNKPNSVQTVFILDEGSAGANDNRRFLNKILPLMLSKLFHESSDLVHLVTFVRYTPTAAETLRSLVKTLDATKPLRISVLTNRTVQEMDNFAETVEEFLNESGYSFEMQVVRLAVAPTKRYKLVDINANESNEFIAEQLVAMSLE